MSILKDSNQILTAQSDGGGNYHSQGAVHTGPSTCITPGEGGGGGDRRAGMNSTEGVIISTTIQFTESVNICFIYQNKTKLSHLITFSFIYKIISKSI